MYIFKVNTLWCAKGGGGGGSSGKIDYPDYMETFHKDLLNDDGTDSLTSSFVDIMNSSLSSSPYTGAASYDPDTDITAMLASVSDFETLVDLLSSGTSLNTRVADILSATYVDNAVTEFEADLDARLTAEVLPRFEAGMRDINAVVSSAFVNGKAIIEDGHSRQAARFSSELHLKAASDDAIRIIALKLEFMKSLASLDIESLRIKMAAKKEEATENIDIDVADATWDLELFQRGSNLLAGIGGGVLRPDDRKKSQLSTTIGGALSGGAAGAMIGAQTGMWGGPAGMVGGAILGAAASLL